MKMVIYPTLPITPLRLTKKRGKQVSIVTKRVSLLIMLSSTRLKAHQHQLKHSYSAESTTHIQEMIGLIFDIKKC
jgi:hypothetical protein